MKNILSNCAQIKIQNEIFHYINAIRMWAKKGKSV